MNQHHDIAAGNNPREQALVNLHRLTVQGCRFPNKVFLRDWAGYYFFDSDHLFDGEFVETAKALIKCEASICICVSDLEAVAGEAGSTFFVDSDQTGDAYRAFLNGPTAGSGWMHDVSRFGIVSDLGHWAIYCERQSEIAVMAIKQKNEIELYAAQLASWKAMPIERALNPPLSYGFSPQALSAEWRCGLLKSYRQAE